MSAVSPEAADRIRKVSALLLAGAMTFLLLRVLARLANGRQDLLDWELWAFLGLAALGVLWMRSVRRFKRRPPAASSDGDSAP